MDRDPVSMLSPTQALLRFDDGYHVVTAPQTVLTGVKPSKDGVFVGRPIAAVSTADTESYDNIEISKILGPNEAVIQYMKPGAWRLLRGGTSSIAYTFTGGPDGTYNNGVRVSKIDLTVGEVPSRYDRGTVLLLALIATATVAAVLLYIMRAMRIKARTEAQVQKKRK
jgi:hypothetical protein